MVLDVLSKPLRLYSLSTLSKTFMKEMELETQYTKKNRRLSQNLVPIITVSTFKPEQSLLIFYIHYIWFYVIL